MKEKNLKCYKLLFDAPNKIPVFNQKKEIIPTWLIKGNYNMSLDKFYTYPKYAKYCYDSLLTIAKLYQIDVSNYTFLEPYAGDGAFLDLLPVKKRIGMDLEPGRSDIIKKDFFDWEPDKDKKYITVGNPPFGLRSWLALAFINKAAQFSDLVGFILPMYFSSDGKGSAKNRVKGLHLLHSEELPSDIFHNGVPVKINTVWQIWGKVEPKSTEKKTINTSVEIFTVCTNPARRCELDKLDKYALFISSTFYDKIKICKKFEEVKYGSGYGLIISKNKDEIEKYLYSVDWLKYNMRATNHCRHIGKTHIIQALIDGGF